MSVSMRILIIFLFFIHKGNAQSIDSKSYSTVIFNTAELDSFYLVINENFGKIIEMATGDSIYFPEGEYRLRFFQKYYQDVRLNITLDSDSEQSYLLLFKPFGNDKIKTQKLSSSYPRIAWNGVGVIVSDPDTDIALGHSDSRKQYQVIEDHGNFEVNFLNQTLSAEENVRFELDSTITFKVFQNYFRPEKRKVVYYSLLPGVAQIYKGENRKGYLLGASTLLSFSLSLYSYSKYQSLNRDYENKLSLYQRSSEVNELFILGNQINTLNKRLTNYGRVRDGSLLLGVLLYAFNIYDGLKKPEFGYRISFDPYLDFPDFNGNVIGIRGSYDF